MDDKKQDAAIIDTPAGTHSACLSLQQAKKLVRKQPKMSLQHADLQTCKNGNTYALGHSSSIPKPPTTKNAGAQTTDTVTATCALAKMEAHTPAIQREHAQNSTQAKEDAHSQMLGHRVCSPKSQAQKLMRCKYGQDPPKAQARASASKQYHGNRICATAAASMVAAAGDFPICLLTKHA